MTDPRPPIRGLATVAELAAGRYLLKINGVDYAADFATTPGSADEVLQELLEAIGEDNKLVRAWVYGVAGSVEGLAFMSYDQDVELTLDNTANLSIVLMTPPDAMTLANLNGEFARIVTASEAAAAL